MRDSKCESAGITTRRSPENAAGYRADHTIACQVAKTVNISFFSAAMGDIDKNARGLLKVVQSGTCSDNSTLQAILADELILAMNPAEQGPAVRRHYSGGTFERSRFSANFGTLKEGPASVLFSRLLRPNNSAAAALQLAAPVLQQRRVSSQPHTKNETRIRKNTKRHPAAR